MSLYNALQLVKSEEDVKDAYIKALGLKSVSKGLVDIQTDEIWFEAKDKPKSTYEMFTQLLHYVHYAFKKGEKAPPFLAVIDTKKAALMKTSDIMSLFEDKAIKWGQDSSSGAKRSASQFTKDTLDKVSAHIGTHFVSFRIDTHEQEFIETVKAAIKQGDIIRTQITPDNLKQVFDKWVDMIGVEIESVSQNDLALLFFADIMHDGTKATHDLPAELVHGEVPFFLLNERRLRLASYKGYREFWQIYDRPPKAEYRNYLLERRDTLIPIDERSFKGAYYTPLKVVDKAYNLLTETLGKNWQKNYIIWDMCCGVGNLEVKHSNPRNIFMSTLDQADIDVMRASKTCVAATRFQYDYLNDDIGDDGKIDYSLTNKVPPALQQAIKEGKKILVLINPPYAEATNSANASISSRGDQTSTKEGVAKSKFAATAMDKYGKASNELFMQFIVRIAQEIPSATLAIFSKLKYITAPTLNDFRNTWGAKYLGGFVVHSKAFDGLKGNFPIGFLVWNTDMQSKVRKIINVVNAEVLDKNAQPIGEKAFYPALENHLLTNWIERQKANKTETIPLKNAVTPATTSKDLRGTKWANGAIGWLNCPGNDIQQANLTALLSSGFSSGRGLFVTPENLWQTAVVFSVRRLIKPTWLNDRDQFLQPTEPLTDEFKNDCLIWMLFNGSNLTAGANNLEWNEKKWALVNHFIPFTEEQVGAPDRFESNFMSEYLKGKKLSPEAKAVLKKGQNLWQIYFSQPNNHRIRAELKLNRPDIGWYQMRKALEARMAEGDHIDFGAFKTAYEALSNKLQSQVFELGFMRD
jgi:hypothetical protein